MRRVAGGIAGWLAAVLPLLGVNLAGIADVFDTETAVIAGAAALVGGIVLGAIVTGLLAGRPTPTRAGGASAMLPAGIIAAALYIASLIAVVVVATRTDAAPEVMAAHPLRITGAIVCLGALLLGASLLVGMLAGRQAAPTASQTLPFNPARAGERTREWTRETRDSRRAFEAPNERYSGDSGTTRDQWAGNYPEGYDRDYDRAYDRDYQRRRDSDRSRNGERQPAPHHGGSQSYPSSQRPPDAYPRHGVGESRRDDRRSEGWQ